MMLIFVLGPLFPNLCAKIPNERWDKLADLAVSLKVIAAELLNKADMETTEDDADRSIIGVMGELLVSLSGLGDCHEFCMHRLVRSEKKSFNVRLSIEEITTQVCCLKYDDLHV